MIQSSISDAEARQQVHINDQISRLLSLQQEDQQANEEAMLSLHSNQLSLEQLPHQFHEVQQQLAQRDSSTQDQIANAIAASEKGQQEQVQNLHAQLQQQQEALESASAILQARQDEASALPWQLEDAQQQIARLTRPFDC